MGVYCDCVYCVWLGELVIKAGKAQFYFFFVSVTYQNSPVEWRGEKKHQLTIKKKFILKTMTFCDVLCYECYVKYMNVFWYLNILIIGIKILFRKSYIYCYMFILSKIKNERNFTIMFVYFNFTVFNVNTLYAFPKTGFQILMTISFIHLLTFKYFFSFLSSQILNNPSQLVINNYNANPHFASCLQFFKTYHIFLWFAVLLLL